MNHAEAVKDAERDAANAACALAEWERTRAEFISKPRNMDEVDAHAAKLDEHYEACRLSGEALIALRAATCGTCGGTGWVERAMTREPFGERITVSQACPAGCKEGRKP